MKETLLVGLGGFIGAVARFKLGGFVAQRAVDWKFPLGTFVVNVTGCFVAGLLVGYMERHDVFGADARLFLFLGVLGGFTTFSAFGLETVTLIQRKEMMLALLNVMLSVGAGVLALMLGAWAAR